MRRWLLLAAGLVLILVGCTELRPITPNPPMPTSPPPIPTIQSAADTDVDIAVLRDYFSPASKTSFKGYGFPVVYIVDRVYARGSDGTAKNVVLAVISPADQQRVIAAFRDHATIRFVADGQDAIVRPNGCAQVRDHGILLTFTVPVHTMEQTTEGLSGFVACLGADGFEYQLREDAQGWTVTGSRPLWVA